MDQRKRNPNGTFQKGQPPPKEAHRKRGVLNKITKDIREGAIEGFARHGSNGRGEGGFAGYIYFLSKRHPKAACRIIEKLLPLTVHGTPSMFGSIGTVNIVPVAHGNFLSHEDILRIHAGAPLLEHEPAKSDPPSDLEGAEIEPGDG